MAKVYTSRGDEDIITLVLRKGLLAQGHKWTVLRMALALSLKQSAPPDESFDALEGGKDGEYTVEVLTGGSQKESEGFVDAFRALLSAYHQQDLFDDKEDKLYARLLQRHIRRGLREIHTSWRESHDFHEYLYQEFFTTQGEGHTLTAHVQSNESLLHALEELGLTAEITETREGPRVTRQMVRLADAEDYGRLERRLEDLAFTLGLKDAGVFLSPAGEPKTILLDVPRPPQQWKQVGANLLGSWAAPTSGLPVLLGVDVEGKPVIHDLAEAPHLLVAGTTGSGKSVCLHVLLLSILTTRSPQRAQLVLIDPKRVEFTPYQGIPSLYAPVITEGIEAARCLKGLVREMESREKLLASRSAREWGELSDNAPPRLVVVVEELAELLAQSPEAEESLVRLAQKARAAGIHLVLATQRPDAATFSGLLRANIPSRIALTVQKGADSRIILDEMGAEKLLGKGDMLVKWLGGKTTRVHGINLTPDDISAYLRQTRKEG
jgi:S-DNA-T family DNA segregation ATPase FtsK/SpoIIIE